MAEVYALSDFVLVPTLPSIIDAMAVRQVIAEIIDSGAPYGLVLNRVKPGTLLTSQIREQLVKMGFNVLKSELVDRVSYQRAIIRKSLQATEDEKMIAEVSRLSGEIFRLLTVRR
jgi:chromosome partitioning protein